VYSSEIIFEEFLPICIHETSSSRTDGRTDRLTDGLTTCRSYTALRALRIASRGKNTALISENNYVNSA